MAGYINRALGFDLAWHCWQHSECILLKGAQTNLPAQTPCRISEGLTSTPSTHFATVCCGAYSSLRLAAQGTMLLGGGW